VPVLDGNVVRLLARVFAVDLAVDRAAGRKLLTEIAAALVSGPRPGDLNQAMMEIGACVCAPRAPDCAACPVERWCGALARDAVGSYPRRAVPKPAREDLALTFAWIEDARGVWLERRPPEGLWGGQWQLPSEHGRGARSRLAERLNARLGRTLARIDHELTHRRVRATVLHATIARPPSRSTTFRRFSDVATAPVSGIARRAIARVLAQRAHS
jgi:A/G-specific adenine glycosylase